MIIISRLYQTINNLDGVANTVSNIHDELKDAIKKVEDRVNEIESEIGPKINNNLNSINKLKNDIRKIKNIVTYIKSIKIPEINTSINSISERIRCMDKIVFTLMDMQMERDIINSINNTDEFIESSIKCFRTNTLNKKKLIHLLSKQSRTISIVKYSKCAPILYLYYKEKYKETSLLVDDIGKIKIHITIPFKKLYTERLNKELSRIKKKFNKKKQSK